MNHYIALLRGINVSGHKLIKMSDLKLMFAKCGFTNVSTYIQSGNIVFSSSENKKDVQKKIESSIHNTYGFEVPTLILSNQELKEVKENHPFLRNNTYETKAIYFGFLDEIPKQELVRELHSLKQETEFFEIKDKLIFCCYPNSYGTSKWNNVFFEKKLKVNCTTRNYNTVNKLIELSEKFD